jgi:hypothetical protein
VPRWRISLLAVSMTATWLLAAFPDDVTVNPRSAAQVLQRLTSGAPHSVGLRPNRVEPRAIKRRSSGHKRLTQRRAKLLDSEA